MSRIYEALQLQELETPLDSRLPGHTHPAVTAPRPAATKFEERLLALYRRIEAILDGNGARVVSIASMGSVRESFTYTHQLALIVARQFRLRVLILCTAGSGASQHLLRDANAHRGWEDAAFRDKPLAESIHRLDDSPIHVSQLNACASTLPALAGSPRIANFMTRVRKRYDLILIDSRPISDGMDATLLSCLADGTVLIVDAGTYRWQVVRSAVEHIQSQQGTLLGIVLNKRRHYIPNFIYRRL